MKRLLLIFFFTLPGIAFAQKVQTDTVGLYRNIYDYSKNKKFVYLFYRAIFNVPKDPLKETHHDVRDTDDKRFHDNQGNRIRNLRVVTLEPFGTTLTDTIADPRNIIQKVGNALHFTTRTRIVRNILLFEEGGLVDALEFSESERLLRATGFIRDVYIDFVNEDTVNREVDVVVYARDYWSFSVTTTFTSQKVRARLIAYNMFGMGHRLSNRFDYRYKESPGKLPNYQGFYLIPNIGRTFITTELYFSSERDEQVTGISVNRLFYSPTTVYAGGFTFFNKELSDSINISGAEYEPYSFSSGEYSVWGGKSFLLRKGSSLEEKSTRLIASLAYTRYRFRRLEVFSPEAASRFGSSDLYLAGIGISNRKYYTDRYIFRFGEKEDVPSGRLIKAIGGYEFRGDSSRYYMQFGIGGSSYIRKNRYLSMSLGYGTFIRESDFDESVLSLSAFGFSGLITGGRWKTRVFGNLSWITGINRQPGEVISLNDVNGIAGYRAPLPRGTSRIVLNLSAVMFNPFEWIGFRVSPVVFVGAGMTGDNEVQLGQGKVYKSIGAGIAVTNVFLANSSFRIFFGYYPDIKSSPTRVSSFEVWDYTFNDYYFGKPVVLNFD